VIDARQQHHIRQGEVQSLGEHVLQRRQVGRPHFPDLAVLPGGGRKNRILHGEFGKSCPEFKALASLSGLFFLGFFAVFLLVLLLLLFLSPSMAPPTGLRRDHTRFPTLSDICVTLSTVILQLYGTFTEVFKGFK
jgi:hypothetical protein